MLLKYLSPKIKWEAGKLKAYMSMGQVHVSLHDLEKNPPVDVNKIIMLNPKIYLYQLYQYLYCLVSIKIYFLCENM